MVEKFLSDSLLGDITNARATEAILSLWVRLYGNLQTPMFNFKIVQ